MRAVVLRGEALFDVGERAFLSAVSRLAFANPFLPERIAAERAALRDAFVDVGLAWSLRPDGENATRIHTRLGALLTSARHRLATGVSATPEERALYEDACLYFLQVAHAASLQELLAPGSPSAAAAYTRFLAGYQHLFHFPGSTLSPPEPERVFAYCFQIQRALHHLVSTLRGASRPMAALRAAVWQAIFTCDQRDYLASPAGAMDDISTVITGPTGSGKELVANTIGCSSYLALGADDPAQARFVAGYEGQMATLNLSALSPSLIESELFGHARGAYTGATADHSGWLEACGRSGSVFLDEIGELDRSIQVKLLRVLESRIFQRLGDTQSRRFGGRILSATHRDLAALIDAGLFREDLYQRLCACSIRTPSLREQLDDAPGERRHLVRYLAGGVRPRKADALTDQVETWIDENLPPDYPWPGNVRQLQQCVREIYVNGAYNLLRPIVRVAPAAPAAPAVPSDDEDPARSLRNGTLTEDDAMNRYATIVLAQTGSVTETARILGVHRHTVTRRVDHALLARLTGQTGAVVTKGTKGKKRPPKRG